MVKFPEDIYSEFPAIKLMQKMGYTAATGDTERGDLTETVLLPTLRRCLQRINPDLSAENIERAVRHLTSVTGTSLMEINQKTHELLHGGHYNLKQKIDGKEEFLPVRFIDYAAPDNNEFLVVNQMRFYGKAQNSVPDLTVFVNGLPVAVIECKSPDDGTPWDKAYGDLAYYQSNSERLFYCNQICVGIWRNGGRYGALDAPQKFYSVYRPAKDEDLTFLGEKYTPQDVLLYAIFRKERLLDIIRHYVIFETEEGKTVKKLPRYQQIRATDKTIARLQNDTGGVVWHTQGSGKSITMAYVTRKLQAPEFGFDNPTVMVLTDRRDLDRQITNTLRNVGFKNVSQAGSVAHLDTLLSNDYGGIITTTLQKFQEPRSADASETGDQTEAEENEDIRVEKTIEDGILTKVTKEKINGKWTEIGREEIVLEELSSKKNLYVLVDEAHRSQYGFLAAFMRTILPHAKFVAFTGTPISKEDKSTLGEFYGGKYIDVYTIKESVADGATVELLYDVGIEKLDVKKEALDKEFAEKFGHESAEKQDKLKREALKDYSLSPKRIRSVCRHITQHFGDKIYPDGHKALIVCTGRHAALQYQKMLTELREKEEHNFKSELVLSIGSPKTDKIARDYYAAVKHNRENPHDPQPLWVTAPEDIKTVTENFKLPYGDESVTDAAGKKAQFNNTSFLIVSDMLLTGYDVPIASCLYLDKPLREHNLLQAIARVNRSGKRKKAGYIIDYYGITANLLEALEIFSGDLTREDIVKNLEAEIPVLTMHHQQLVDFFGSLRINRLLNPEAYIDKAVQYIEPLDRRDVFKTLLKNFNKSVNIVLPHQAAMQFKEDFELFNLIKLHAKNTYADDDELKVSADESLLLQQMMNAHLTAHDVTNLLEEPVSIFDRKKLEAELEGASLTTKELKMRNKLTYSIKTGEEKNPDFYKPLAQQLEKLLQDKTAKRIDEAQLLLAYAKMQDKMINAEKEAESKGFDTEQKREVFKSMQIWYGDNAEDTANTVLDLLKGELNIVGWRDKEAVKNDMRVKMTRYFKTLGAERAEAKGRAKDLLGILEKN